MFQILNSRASSWNINGTGTPGIQSRINMLKNIPSGLKHGKVIAKQVTHHANNMQCLVKT